MRRYETIFISHADLPEEEINSMVETYSAIIKAGKGLIVKTEKWGKRRLAYEIDKHARGYYVLFDFAADPEVVTELERNLRIADKILKYMTVKTRETVKPEDIEKEIAAEAAKKAPPAEGGEPAPATPGATAAAAKETPAATPSTAAAAAKETPAATPSTAAAAAKEVPAATGEVQSAVSSPEPDLKEEAKP